jgi:hypothetical protein
MLIVLLKMSQQIFPVGESVTKFQCGIHVSIPFVYVFSVLVSMGGV